MANGKTPGRPGGYWFAALCPRSPDGLDQARPAIEDEPATGPLRRLAAHDGPDGVLTETLAVFLAVGCVAEDAATRLRVHVNTLRYRLRRIREVSGLDFQDADQMLLAQLQLRLSGALS